MGKIKSRGDFATWLGGLRLCVLWLRSDFRLADLARHWAAREVPRTVRPARCGSLVQLPSGEAALEPWLGSRTCSPGRVHPAYASRGGATLHAAHHAVQSLLPRNR